MNSEIETREHQLIALISDAWRDVPPSSLQSLVMVQYETTSETYDALAGIAPLEVDRDSFFEFDFALHWMTPEAVVTYLCAYMIKIIENMPAKRAEHFLLDQHLIVQTYSALSADSFRETFLTIMTSDQRATVKEFIQYSLDYSSLLDLEEDQLDKIRQVR